MTYESEKIEKIKHDCINQLVQCLEEHHREKFKGNMSDAEFRLQVIKMVKNTMGSSCEATYAEVYRKLRIAYDDGWSGEGGYPYE